MGELRKHYLLDRYVIVANERAKRPVQLKECEKQKTDSSQCPFCHLQDKDIIQETSCNGDKIINVPNKFPAVKAEGNPVVKTDNEFFTFSDAFGYHEVMIETMKHDLEMEDLPIEHITKILENYSQRIQYLREQPNIRYVSVFKNRGIQAGASLAHSHSQIVALNVLPNSIVEEFKACYDYRIKKGRCPYCRIIDIEKGSYRRVFENEHAVCFTPYASEFPYEIWFFPKRHTPSLTLLTSTEIRGMGELLKKTLMQLNKLGYPPYNLEVYEDSPHGEFHFHIQVTPRLNYWAGFELETGTIINSTPPELAAQFYRGEI